jgi:hypothetical protein
MKRPLNRVSSGGRNNMTDVTATIVAVNPSIINLICCDHNLTLHAMYHEHEFVGWMTGCPICGKEYWIEDITFDPVSEELEEYAEPEPAVIPF